jgi:hypothetical protein
MHLCHRLDAHSWIIILDNFIQNIDPFCKKSTKKTDLPTCCEKYIVNVRSATGQILSDFSTKWLRKAPLQNDWVSITFFFTQKDLCKYMHLSSRKDKL